MNLKAKFTLAAAHIAGLSVRAAVNGQVRARDVRGFRPGNERDQRRDILDDADNALAPCWLSAEPPNRRGRI